MLEAEITERFGMNYAASIDDDNPIYFDNTREEGIVTPPMATVALTWPLTSQTTQQWDPATFTEQFPHEVMQRQVHYTETLLWHRTLRPGDRLKIKGHIAAILPHRAGTHITVSYEARDPDGALVFTEYIGALLRRVRCAGEANGEENLPVIPTCPDDAEPKWSSPIQLSPMAAHIYDACSDMHFPIHTSIAFARSVGLKNIIFQGTGTLTYAARELVNRETDRDPRRLKAISCTFTGMVLPGTEITVRLLDRALTPEGTDLFFDVLNEQGGKAISNGHARISPA